MISQVRPVLSQPATACLAALPAAAGTLVYAGFFASRAYLPVLLGAAAVAAPLAALAGTRRWRADGTLATAVLGCLAYLSYALFRPDLDHGFPGPRTVAAIAAALAHGWGRMLTVALPADVGAALLVLPATVTWAASFAAVTIAVRTSSRLGRLAPGTVAFALAVLIAASSPGAQRAGSATFVAACAAVLACPARMPVRGAAAWSVVVAACATTVVLVAAVAGAELAAPLMTHRVDPRALDPAVVQVNQSVTPLATIRSQLEQHPAKPVATVTLSGPGASAVDFIRTAALEDYDGSAWTSADRFLVAGHVLAGDPGLRQGLPVTARVTLAAGAGPYLPEVGWPTSISWQSAVTGQETGTDQDSGILVAQGLAASGGTYTLTAEVRPGDGFSHAVLMTDPADTTLPGLAPAPLVRKAQQVTAGQRTTYGKLMALDKYLRSLPYNLDAPPGHSYGALTRMLTGTAPGDSAGYSEQHAAAFAVLARILGIPVRVATGYRVTSGPGVHRITTADAYAWDEVPFDGYGWVPFDPTDTANTQAIPGAGVAAPQVTVSPPPSPPPPSQPAASPAPRSNASQRDISWYGPAVLAALGLAAALAAGLGASAAAKGLRQLRRRRLRDPTGRLLGAWQSARDRLIERGLDIPPAMAASDVALRAVHQFGQAASPVGALAALVDLAVFAPGEPTPAEADLAWRHYRELLGGLYPRRCAPARIIALFSARPLVASYRQAREARGRPRYRYRAREGDNDNTAASTAGRHTVPARD
jgi:transglutaminase-like putative cysteine protease